MSQQIFDDIVNAFDNWRPRRVHEDVVCLYEVSKDVHGTWQNDLERREVQTCDQLDCQTLKTYMKGSGEISAHGCDSDQAAVLDGTWDDMEVVRSVIDGDWERRGAHTGRFVWNGSGATAHARFRGISRAGAHRNCEECYTPNHWEGWIRAAIVEGEHQGCTIHANYAYTMDPMGDPVEAVAFSGGVEGVIICQCD